MLPGKKTTVSSECRDAVNRLHEVKKCIEIVQLNLKDKESDFNSAITIFVLFIGLAAADFLAATTVVYSIGPNVGLTAQNAFWDPAGGIFMNYTWFGIGLIAFIILSLFALSLTIVLGFYRRATRKEVIIMNEKLKEAKSHILEVCPMELWYSADA